MNIVVQLSLLFRSHNGARAVTGVSFTRPAHLNAHPSRWGVVGIVFIDEGYSLMKTHETLLDVAGFDRGTSVKMYPWETAAKVGGRRH